MRRLHRSPCVENFRPYGASGRHSSNHRHVLRTFWVEELEERIQLKVSLDFDSTVLYEQVSKDWFSEASRAVPSDSRAVALRGVDAGMGPLPTADDPQPTREWIVRLTRESLDEVLSVDDSVDLLVANTGRFDVVRGLGLPGQLLIQSRGMSSSEAEATLRANHHVAYFEPNTTVIGQEMHPECPDAPNCPDDPSFYDQVNLKAIHARDAWDHTTGRLEVVIGVVDTGIDTTHPDLYKNVWINQGELPPLLLREGRPLSRAEFEAQLEPLPKVLIDLDDDGLITFWDLNFTFEELDLEHPVHNETSRVHEAAGIVMDLNENEFIDAQDLRNSGWADGIDTDGNEFVDDLIGWDFRNNDNDPTDDHRHGTHVAGIIGAIGDNNLGMTGVNWKSSLMPLKFLDQDNRGVATEAILAINYATMMKRDYGVNIRVTNNSWGEFAEFNAGLLDAIAASGQQDMLFVAAAGNGNVFGDGIDLDRDPFFPASYNLENIISVAALDPDGRLARFSNFGRQTVDIAAPGVDILSTRLDGATESRNGTSMAAPHVTGVAALVFANQPDATAAEVRDAILRGGNALDSSDKMDLSDKIEAGRTLNARGALQAETFGPQVCLDHDNGCDNTAPDITSPGVSSQILTLRFRDDEGVDERTLNDSDLLITRDGFSAVQMKATFQPESLSRPLDPTDFTAQYKVLPPDHPFDLSPGVWHAIDNGTYNVTLQHGEVRDKTDIGAGRRRLGSFEVRINDADDPAILFVNHNNDLVDDDLADCRAANDVRCVSLRAAMQRANGGAGNTVIVVPDGVYPFSIPPHEETEDGAAAGDLEVMKDVTMIGAGAGNTTIDARFLDRIFDVRPNVTFRLAGVTLINGNAATGGSIRNLGDLAIELSTIRDNTARQEGGGLFNASTLMISDSTISGNETTSPLGKGGGGIFNRGLLTVERSTLSNNSAAGGFIGEGGGGGIFNRTTGGTVQIRNSTFSGNTGSNGDGAGILHAAGDINITHVTITKNRAEFGNGGGISVSETCEGNVCNVHVRNSIIADNAALSDDDIMGDIKTNHGNLIGVDAVLGPLRDNGGQSQTHAPLAGSPAIDAAFSLDLSDQRGISRPFDARRVTDIHNSEANILIEGTPIVFQDDLYFTTSDDDHGAELWKSDGTEQGTVRVTDINPGVYSSRPQDLTVIDQQLYFTAFDGPAGRELWKTDGTEEGTGRIADICPGNPGRNVCLAPSEFVSFLGEVYFVADDGVTGRELWKTDGTEPGTRLVADIKERVDSSFPRELTVVGEQLFFIADDGHTGRELWTSDGTEEGTRLVADVAGPGGSPPGRLTAFRDELYFTADDGNSGVELWKSDGIETALVADIRLGSRGSFPTDFAVLGEELFFNADDGNRGKELWKSDGTQGGTQLVMDIRPGAESSYVFRPTTFDGAIYFSANDGITGFELWRSDGTREGTRLVADLRQGQGADGLPLDSAPEEFTVFNGELYFTADDGTTGRDLWKSNGTDVGTLLVANISPDNSRPRDFTVLNNLLVFQVDDGALHTATMKYSVEANEATLFSAAAGNRESGSSPDELTVLGSELFFVASDGGTGQELWKSDGSRRGTRQVADIRQGIIGSKPEWLTVFDGKLYFTADDGIHGRELWKSDGSRTGTALVRDLRSGPQSSVPVGLTAFQGKLFFMIDNGLGRELWQSDGTTAGTRHVAALHRASSASFFAGLAEVKGELYFVADDGSTGQELWKSDGTERGTKQVRDIYTGEDNSSFPDQFTVFADKLFFVADDGSLGRELWRSDGTPEGTQRVADIRQGPASSAPAFLAVFKNELYFLANFTPDNGRELWKSDGTSSGTGRVADIPLGGRPGTVRATVFDGELYFTAGGVDTDFELWKSDGTEAGTRRVANARPGPDSADTLELITFNGELYFTSDDGTGSELRVFTPRQSVGAVQNFFSQIGGIVYHDANRDGTQGSDEPGLIGWTVYVDLNANGALDAGEPNSMTRADDPETAILETGRYVIGGLESTDHTIRVVRQSGFDSSFSVDVADSSAKRIAAMVTASLRVPDANADFERLEKRPAIVRGRVVFQDQENQIFMADESIVPLAQLDTPMARLRAFSSIDPSVAFSGDFVAFSARDAEGNSGVYIASSLGAVSKIADESTALPGPATLDGKTLLVESIVGELAAFGVQNQDSVKEALLAGTVDGGLVEMASLNTMVPDRDVPFRRFDTVKLDRGSYALQGAFEDNGKTFHGIYNVDSDSLTTVVDTTTRIPRGSGVFRELGLFSYSTGRVAFHGSGADRLVGGRQTKQEGIYFGSRPDDLTVIADTSTSIPSGNSTFTSFAAVSQDQGNIVFVGNRHDGQHGIYTNLGGKLTKVVDLGDFEGNEPSLFSLGPQATSGNQIVFHVTFDGDLDSGGQAIYVATYAADRFHLVSLDQGEAVEDKDFGQRALPGAIGGQKFNDINANARKDEGEAGLRDWTIFLDQNGNGLLDVGEPSTVTDADGNYEFPNLPALTDYAIADVPQAGWSETLPSASDGGRWNVFLEAGERRRDVDFGVHNVSQVGGAGRDGVIEGTVFEDTNGNGRRDEKEIGMPNRLVFLDVADDGVRNGNEPVRRTDENGHYEFRNQAPGTYIVRVQLADSFKQTTPNGNSFIRLTNQDVVDLPAAVAFAPSANQGPGELIVARSTSNLVSILRDPIGESPNVFVKQVGATPVAITVADFDGDGTDDIAVANEGSDNVSIMLRNTSGPPTTAGLFAVGDKPRALASGDVDNDGDVDLAVANASSNDITILFNDGSANFHAAAPVPVGNSPSGIVLMSGEDDSSIELAAVSLRNDNQVALLRNDGKGRFSVIDRVEVGQSPIGLTAALLDGDNRLDLAVATFAKGRVTILTTAQSDLPVKRHNYSVGTAPTSILSADIDQDGDQDVIVSVEDAVSILRNRGNGGFQSSEFAGSVVFRFQSVPLGLAAGDFDGDRDVDLALANGVANGVTVLRNNIVAGAVRVEVIDSTPVGGDFGLQPVIVAHNEEQPLDVDDSGRIVPYDALLVINELNERLISDENTGQFLTHPIAPALFPDVNNDGFATPHDALLIINYLNRPPVAIAAVAATDQSIHGEWLLEAFDCFQCGTSLREVNHLAERGATLGPRLRRMFTHDRPWFGDSIDELIHALAEAHATDERVLMGPIRQRGLVTGECRSVGQLPAEIEIGTRLKHGQRCAGDDRTIIKMLSVIAIAEVFDTSHDQ